VDTAHISTGEVGLWEVFCCLTATRKQYDCKKSSLIAVVNSTQNRKLAERRPCLDTSGLGVNQE
jgi:hypothetical protein